MLVAPLCYHAMKRHGRADAFRQYKSPNIRFCFACLSRALFPAGLLRHRNPPRALIRFQGSLHVLLGVKTQGPHRVAAAPEALQDSR